MGNREGEEGDGRRDKSPKAGGDEERENGKINMLGERWEGKKTGYRKEKEEHHYLWLSQHCVEVECLGGGRMFGTIIWHGADPSQEISAIWLMLSSKNALQ